MENTQEIKYKAVRYIRLSSADDHVSQKGNQESDSVANQRKLIDDYLKKHPEIEVVSEKVDDGYSGILFDRPAFKEMMQEVEEGKINCIISKDLSRLGREYIETGRYLRRIFPAYGVRFIAITDNIDTLNDSTDDLSLSLKTIMNDAYCRDISVKTRSALDVKRASGDYVGAFTVYGYKKSEENHNKLVVDDFAAEVVRDIFRMKLEGVNAVAIAALLNEKGVLSPIEYKKDRGQPHANGGYCVADDAKWSATTIIRMLKDETYIGTLIQGKTGTPNYKLKEIFAKPKDEWYRHENAHEAIIKPQDFDLVGRLMRLDTRTSPGGDKVYLFSGVLICGSCGNRMTRKTNLYKGKEYFYYYCPTGKKNGCTSVGMVKESELTGCILDSVKSHVTNIASLEVLIAGLDAEKVGRELANNLTSQLLENDRRLNNIREFKAGLYENMMTGLLSKEEHKSLKDKYNVDSEVLIASNVKLQKEIDDVLTCKHERLEWTSHFREFENLEVIDRKTVVRLIQDIKIFSKTELQITFNYQAEYESTLEILQRGIA